MFALSLLAQGRTRRVGAGFAFLSPPPLQQGCFAQRCRLRKAWARVYKESGKSSSLEGKSFVTRSQLPDLQQEPFLKGMGCEGPQERCHSNQKSHVIHHLSWQTLPTKY